MSNQDESRRSFQIPAHLNKGKRISGLPMNEVLPALVMFMFCFAAEKYMTGIVIATVWFMGLRSLKVKYGNNVIQLAIYWYGSSSASKPFFKRTPSSNRRYWIF